MHIFIIMLGHNTFRHNGQVEKEKAKCNINVIPSSHHASILIIISKIDYSHIRHSFYRSKNIWIRTNVSTDEFHIKNY